MKYELVIVRYGEIALKGKETRRRFENILVSNIKNAFGKEKIPNKIKKEWGRIYIFTDQIQKSINVLKKVFGITSVSPAVQIKSNMSSISKLAVKIAKENNLTEKKSFALRVNRTGSHSFSSQDVAVKIGNDVVNKTGAKVNLDKPDFELFIEIRNENAYFFPEKIRSIGGMPLGTQGNVLCLADSLDSVLAAWYLMRRGCKVFFFCTDELITDAIADFSDNWYARLEIIQTNAKIDDFYDILNKKCNELNCNAVVTGHSFYAESNDWLSDIQNLKNNCALPVLHPLIAMEKNEIKNKSREIGLKK